MADINQEANQASPPLDPDKVQSVTSNGVSVTFKSGGDQKAQEEAQTLKVRRKFNPFNSMFRTK